MRPHLSAVLLSRLISGVLVRLLSALDDGDLEDRDVVALALAVDRTAFTAELPAGAGAKSKSAPDHPSRQGVDARQRGKPERSVVDSKQVIHNE